VHLLPIARVTVEAAISSGTLVQSFCDQMRVVCALIGLTTWALRRREA
jgi:hypothetical protein